MPINSVIWTDVAIQSLKETNDFVLESWNESISDDFLMSVDATIDFLENNPFLGLSMENTSYRRALINRHTSLFYEIDRNNLKILLIWDNRQNPDDLMLKIK